MSDPDTTNSPAGQPDVEIDIPPAGAPAQEPAQAGGPDGQMIDPREMVSRVELDKAIRERQAAKIRARNAEARLAELQRQLNGGTGFQPVAANGGIGFQPVGPREEESDDSAGTEDSPVHPHPALRATLSLQGRGVENPHPALSQGRGVAAGGTGFQPVAAAGSDDSVNKDVAANDAATAPELRAKLVAAQEQLASLLRDRELRAAAAAAGAINPDQVVNLLCRRVRMARQEDGPFVPQFLDDRGRVAVDAAGKPVDAETFVRQYLSQPENANLVRATSAGGSGARLAGAPGQSGPPLSLADFNSLPPTERRQVALRLSRSQRAALLGLPGGDRIGYL